MVTVDRGSLRPRGLTEDLEALERDVRALQTALQDTRETAESPDGLVTATANARGELVELTLDPRIYRTPDSAALAADITAAVREAAAQAHQQVYRAVGRSLLPDAIIGSVDLEFDPLLGHLAQRSGREAS